MTTLSISQALDTAREHVRRGRLSQAEALCRAVLHAQPGEDQAYLLLGAAAHLAGRFDQAVVLLQQAIALDPQAGEYYSNLSLALKQLRRLDEAEAAARRAVELCPQLAEAHSNLGMMLNVQGCRKEALAAYQRALALAPPTPQLLSNLAAVLLSLRRSEEAEATCRQALAVDPGAVGAWCNLGGALLAQSRLAEAEAASRKALSLQPQCSEAYGNLGAVLEAYDRLEEAVEAYRRAIAGLGPNAETAATTYSNLGSTLVALGRSDAAEAACRQAIALDPRLALAHSTLGNVLRNQGRVDEASEAYGRAVEMEPDNPRFHDNWIFCQHYRWGVTLAELAERHALWEQRHAAPLAGLIQPHGNDRSPERKLRLGFVSTDLGPHPVGMFLIRIFEALERGFCDTVCYSDRIVKDEVTTRFMTAASLFRDTRGVSDERLAGQIREDRIDILFDLAGHTGGNRLPVFARKPAPIQITWIGYEGTTGLSAMDYLLADRFLVPEEAERHYRERILRLPGCFVCFEPPSYAPPVGPLPAEQTGQVTFGSFNNPSKVTPPVVALWAEILRRVSGSRLVLKYRGFDAPGTQQRYRALFAAEGVEPARLEFQGSQPHLRMLEQYQRIDLALDPWPFQGGMTTCEGMWMGVPAVSCLGETFASRHALSFLSHVGLAELVAQDHAGYVELAVELAGDLPRLAALRGELRGRMARSPICDAARTAADLMRLLRGAWREWAER
jgi:predicted O-linked N-acetylglucosamine transferase (SPINDLY family)